MTTTSATSTSNASTASASAQSIISTLGAGSGVNVKALAQSLVDAEKVPQKAAIDTKIAKSEARISGYGAISYILDDLKTKFAALDDQTDYNVITASSSQTAAINSTVTGQVITGSHSISVSQIARGQRSISQTGFASATAPLANGASVNLSLGGNSLSTVTVNAGATVTQLVTAINSQLGASGIKAQLVNKGSAASDASAPYFIVLTGPTGASNSFSVSGLDFTDPPLQTAQNAALNVDGVDIQSASNSVVDAIPGATLNVTATTVGTATLDLSRNLDSIKAKIKDLVTGYNDVNTVLNAAANKDSQVTGYGASLVGDSTVESIRNQVRKIFYPDVSKGTNGIAALRNIGISIDKTGVMTTDETKLDSALQNNFDDVVNLFSAGRATPTLIHTIRSGIAGDAVKSLSDMLSYSGTLTTQTQNAQKQVVGYQDDLTKLETRMTTLLDRYNKQFSAMESLVGQTNSMKSSLKSSFDGMMASLKA